MEGLCGRREGCLHSRQGGARAAGEGGAAVPTPRSREGHIKMEEGPRLWEETRVEEGVVPTPPLWRAVARPLVRAREGGVVDLVERSQETSSFFPTRPCWFLQVY
jgi:hypothetical protein